MVALKERVKSIIDTMPIMEVERLFTDIRKNYEIAPGNITWEDIEEEEPDEIDLEMLEEIKTNPDCYNFD
jgi:hypothetical protein